MPKTANKNFTDKYILSLKPQPKMYFIREGRGFTIRVMPSGLKTFFYIYTNKSKQAYYKIGHYGVNVPDVTLCAARVKYQAVYNLHKAGHELTVQLAPEVNADPVLFKDFSAAFLVSKGNAKPAVSDVYLNWLRCALDADVLPYWGDRDIKSITRRDAIELLERVAARAPGQVKNVHTAAQGVMQYAQDRDYIEYNPMLRLSNVVPELRANPRKRILSEKEIKTVWNALGSLDSHTALKLILLTAQRPGEVAGMHTDQIGGDTWTVPHEGQEKGGGERLVPLTKTALDLLQGKQGAIVKVARGTISQHVQREMKYYGIPRWTPHDLRRTARTYMAKLGVSDEHAEAVLGHVKPGIIGVYNKYEYYEEKKVALLKWEAELLRIIQQPMSEKLSKSDPLVAIDPLADFTPPTPQVALIPDIAPPLSFGRYSTAIDPLTLMKIDIETFKPTVTETHTTSDPLAF
jgi:integrase